LVEGKAHHGTKDRFAVGRGESERKGLHEALTGLHKVAAVLEETRESEQRGGVLRVEGDRLFVGADGVEGTCIEAIEAGQCGGGCELVRPWLGGARFEVGEELGEVPVAFAVKLGEALKRKRGAGLGKDNPSVPFDENALLGAFGFGGAGRAARARARIDRGTAPSSRVEVLGVGGGDERETKSEQDEETGGAHGRGRLDRAEAQRTGFGRSSAGRGRFGAAHPSVLGDHALGLPATHAPITQPRIFIGQRIETLAALDTQSLVEPTSCFGEVALTSKHPLDQHLAVGRADIFKTQAHEAWAIGLRWRLDSDHPSVEANRTRGTQVESYPKERPAGRRSLRGKRQSSSAQVPHVLTDWTRPRLRGAKQVHKPKVALFAKHRHVANRHPHPLAPLALVTHAFQVVPTGKHTKPALRGAPILPVRNPPPQSPQAEDGCRDEEDVAQDMLLLVGHHPTEGITDAIEFFRRDFLRGDPYVGEEPQERASNQLSSRLSGAGDSRNTAVTSRSSAARSVSSSRSTVPAARSTLRW
jgi:hypothetical protein